MKTCTKCGTAKPKVDYYVRKGGRLHSWCISCIKELRMSRNEEIAEYQRRRRAGRTGGEREREKDYQLNYHFGISLEDYQELLEAQGYSCAVCKKPHGEDRHSQGRSKGLSVDHNHVTGRIRGLLCSDCNRAIGQLQDSPELCRRAAEYLEQHIKAHGRAVAQTDALLEELMNSP